MSGQPIGIFGIKLQPGKVHRFSLLEDLHLTSISYDDSLPLDAPNSRSSLRLHCVTSSGALPADEMDDEEEEDDEGPVEDQGEQTFVLASLSTKASLHSSLSVDFARGEEIGFSISGSHPVDLVGTYIHSDPDEEEGNSDLDSDEYDLSPDSDEYDSEDMEGAEEAYLNMLKEGGQEDSEDDEEADEERFQELDESEPSKPEKKLRAAKAAAQAVNGKKRSREEQEEGGDVSMASSNGATAADTDAELLAAGVKPSELEGLSRNQRKRLNKKLKGVDGEAAKPGVSTEKPAKKEVKKVEVEKKEPKQEPKKEVKKSTKVTLPSGTIIEDKKLAPGGASSRAAKAGDRVGMRYVGKLLKNGKEFDSNTKGKPFSFKLGRGEVIKGWDEGVKGMRVGDERRLTLPPQVAYGSQKIPGIPPNSTLVFDIKLVEIK